MLFRCLFNVILTYLQAFKTAWHCSRNPMYTFLWS